MKKWLILPAGFILFLMGCSADKPVDMDAWQREHYGFIIRTSGQLVSKLGDTNVVFIDTRRFTDYEEARIPGAFPADERGGTARLTLAMLDTSKTVVVYCGTSVCDTKLFPVLAEMNFRNVIYLSDGFGGWIYNGFPVERGFPALQ